MIISMVPLCTFQNNPVGNTEFNLPVNYKLRLCTCQSENEYVTCVFYTGNCSKLTSM